MIASHPRPGEDRKLGKAELRHLKMAQGAVWDGG